MEPFTLIVLAMFWTGFGHTIATAHKPAPVPAISCPSQNKPAPKAVKVIKFVKHKK